MTSFLFSHDAKHYNFVWFTSKNLAKTRNEMSELFTQPRIYWDITEHMFVKKWWGLQRSWFQNFHSGCLNKQLYLTWRRQVHSVYIALPHQSRLWTLAHFLERTFPHSAQQLTRSSSELWEAIDVWNRRETYIYCCQLRDKIFLNNCLLVFPNFLERFTWAISRNRTCKIQELSKNQSLNWSFLEITNIKWTLWVFGKNQGVRSRLSIIVEYENSTIWSNEKMWKWCLTTCDRKVFGW